MIKIKPSMPSLDEQPGLVVVDAQSDALRIPSSAQDLAPLASILDSYRALPHDERSPIVSSLDLRVPANQLIVQRAIAGGSISLWDVPEGTVIEIEHLVAHYTEAVLEETGELSAGPMLTLIGPKATYHTGSEYAYRALQTIAKLTGRRPPFDPPLRILPMRLTSRGRRQYQSILLEQSE